MSKLIVTVHNPEQTVLDALADTLFPVARDKGLQIEMRALSVANIPEEDLEDARKAIDNSIENGPSFGTATKFQDDAHIAADAVLENIRGRRGIGNELESFMYDEEIINEMVDSISDIIRVGMKAV